ncbi:hypothetical protein GCM10027578_07030 [Spirosoma luteolum]
MNATRLLLFLGWLVAGLGPTRPAAAQLARTRPVRPAPTRPAHLFVKAFNYGDSIVLRWNVDRGAYWLAANKRGYVVERIAYLGTREKPVRQRVRLALVRPWSLDSMKKSLSRNDRFVAIAAQLLHGKTNARPEPNTMGDVYRTYERQQGQLLSAAMAAEFSAPAATALGLRWTDRSFDKGVVQYEYRVWINNGPSPRAGDLTDTATVRVSPRLTNTLTPPRLMGVEAGDSVLTVHWQRHHNMGLYAGYYIERSTDGKTFRRLNEVPYVAPRRDSAQADTTQGIGADEVSYRDSVGSNYRTFYYRIIGINSFADLSPASAVVSGRGRDLTPPRPPIDIRKTIEDNRRIVLTWTLPRPDPDLKGFFVGQANEYGGPYVPLNKDLLPPSTRTFVNEKPVPYLGKYYVIAVVDTAGNTAYSYPVTALIDDKVPPAAPARPTARVDTNGVVTLRWPTSREPDVLGYKVYRSYERGNPYYQQRTTDILADSVFTDTLPRNTLTRQAFYQLVAVDQSNNHSLFSESTAVPIPDRVAPSSPIIRQVLVQDRGIQLLLIPSLSDDVVEHVLYRRQAGENWQPIRRIAGHPTTEQALLDTALLSQHTYEYSLMARDAGGRWSERSFIVSAQYVNLQAETAQPPTGLQARYDRAQGSVRLDWKSSALAADRQFMIYRSLSGSPPLPYRLVGAGTSFTDTALPGPGTYTYAVQTIVTAHRSGLSPAVQALVQP